MLQLNKGNFSSSDSTAGSIYPQKRPELILTQIYTYKKKKKKEKKSTLKQTTDSSSISCIIVLLFRWLGLSNSHIYN